MDIQLTDGSNSDGNKQITPDSGESAIISSMHTEALKGLKDMLAGKTSPEPVTSTKPEAVQPSANSTEQPQAGIPTPIPPVAGDKADVPKQFQAKDGSLDENKILKSTQNQEQLNAKKREMIEKYKNLQREEGQLNKTLKEVKPVAEGEKTPAPQNEPDFKEFLTANLTKEEVEVLEASKNEPIVRALLKAQAALAKVSTEDVRREIEMSKAQSRDIALLERLDKLANSHEWLYTDEGKAKLDEVFKQDPGLWKTSDPYGYAVERVAREIAPQESKGGQARPVGTPMLGSGHAIPPSQVETVSPTQELESLSKSVLYNLGDRPKLGQVENELRKKFRDIISSQR